MVALPADARRPGALQPVDVSLCLAVGSGDALQFPEEELDAGRQCVVVQRAPPDE
jgi:hypothetical protein